MIVRTNPNIDIPHPITSQLKEQVAWPLLGTHPVIKQSLLSGYIHKRDNRHTFVVLIHSILFLTMHQKLHGRK